MASDLAFYIAAGVAVLSAMLVVTRRNPVYGAICLIVCFVAVAAIFLHLAAPFVAAAQVIVYAGAIIVLFLFVVMLLNLRPEEYGKGIPAGKRFFMALVAAGVLLSIAIPLLTMGDLDLRQVPEGMGSVEGVGKILFADYVLPFELVSLLIIAVVIGVVVLAGKGNRSSESGEGGGQ